MSDVLRDAPGEQRKIGASLRVFGKRRLQRLVGRTATLASEDAVYGASSVVIVTLSNGSA